MEISKLLIFWSHFRSTIFQFEVANYVSERDLGNPQVHYTKLNLTSYLLNYFRAAVFFLLFEPAASLPTHVNEISKIKMGCVK